jgi:hypothetical protein
VVGLEGGGSTGGRILALSFQKKYFKKFIKEKIVDDDNGM